MTAAIDLTAWHAARAKVVGASESPALFGVQPPYAMSYFTLWMVKAGRIAPPDVPGERPKWGLRLEEVIAEAAAEQEGWKIKRAPRHMVHPTVAGLGCTLDFIIEDQSALGYGPMALECKNVDWLIHKRQWGNEPPIWVQLQLQAQLSVTGWKGGAVAGLVGGNAIDIHRYERHPQIIAEIEKRVGLFWASIEAGEEPPVDGSDSTAHAVRALFPADDGVEVPADLTADNELPELCASLTRLGGYRRQYEAEEKAARNAILAKLGTHRKAWAQGYLLSAPTIPETTYTATRTAYRKLSVKETEKPDA